MRILSDITNDRDLTFVALFSVSVVVDLRVGGCYGNNVLLASRPSPDQKSNQ